MPILANNQGFNKMCVVLIHIANYLHVYSSLPNRRVAWNKRGGWKDKPILISVVPRISMAVGKMGHS